MLASTMVKDSAVERDSDPDSLGVLFSVSATFDIWPPVSVEVALCFGMNMDMDIVVGERDWGDKDKLAHHLFYAHVRHAVG